MAMRGNKIVAFDLYGTILSTESIAKSLAKRFGEDRAPSLAATWRKYQLEYTWRLNSMGGYEPFSTITRRSLHHTVAEAGLTLSASTINDFMQAYDSLLTFPDVPPALDAFAKTSDVTAVIFSNGTHSMVSNSIQRSPDLSLYAEVFKDVITVDDTKRFKPDPIVYQNLAKRLGKDKKSIGDLWMVSGNSFDVVGAKATGMNVVWVDREGVGWTDALIDGEAGRPTAIVNDLGGVLEVIKGLDGN